MSGAIFNNHGYQETNLEFFVRRPAAEAAMSGASGVIDAGVMLGVRNNRNWPDIEPWQYDKVLNNSNKQIQSRYSIDGDNNGDILIQEQWQQDFAIKKL